MNLKSPLLPLTAAAVLTLGACSGAPAAQEGASSGDAQPMPTIVTAFYGLEYAAQQIVGDTATVTSLTQPGQESHDLELKPSQIAEVGAADMVVYLSEFQPAVDEAVAQSGNDHVLDAATVADLLPANEASDHSEEAHDDHSEEAHDDHAHGDHDPHFWLDATRMAKVGQALATQLAQQFPEHKATYEANAKQFGDAMAAIDEEYRTGLAECERKEFITAHAAFNYLAKAYGLTEIGISGINPDDEPSPARIAEVQALAKEHEVTTIFFETLTSPDLTKAIAGDLGLKTAVLDPLEGVTDNSPGTDYPSIMRANLEALKEANGCH